MLLVAGGRSDALRGLGDVSATAEAGGYAQYQAGGFSAKAEVRKGLGGHDGLARKRVVGRHALRNSLIPIGDLAFAVLPAGSRPPADGETGRVRCALAAGEPRRDQRRYCGYGTE